MEQLIKTPADNDLDFYANYFNSECNCYNSFYKPVQDYFKKGAGKDTFKPLDFWNLFWNPFNFIDDSFKQGASNRYTIIEELRTLPLTDREKHIIFGMILKFYGWYPSQTPISSATVTLCLLERAFLSYEPATPEKKFCLSNVDDAALDYYDKAKHYQYNASDFEGISATNDFDFYFDGKNISTPIYLVWDNLKYFEIGKRKAYVEPLAFLNLLWPQVDKINKTTSESYKILDGLNALPLRDEELRHVLFGFILKWFGGYPVKEKTISSYDGTVCRDKLYPVLELIQGEFLGYESTTPEKDYCLKEEEKQKRIDAKAKLDAEIDREKYAFPEIPAPAPTSTVPKKPSNKQKIALDELAKQLSNSNVAVLGAIMKAANKANYTKDNVWKLYGKVKNGELIHKELAVIIDSKNKLD